MATAGAQKKEEDLVSAQRPRARSSGCLRSARIVLHQSLRVPQRVIACVTLTPHMCSRQLCLARAAQDMLEEDDEFEEFEQESWNLTAEDAEDQQLWQDGWDEDDGEGDFTTQLRAELNKPSA